MTSETTLEWAWHGGFTAFGKMHPWILGRLYYVAGWNNL
jgi:hypothetical protein